MCGKVIQKIQNPASKLTAKKYVFHVTKTVDGRTTKFGTSTQNSLHEHTSILKSIVLISPAQINSVSQSLHQNAPLICHKLHNLFEILIPVIDYKMTIYSPKQLRFYHLLTWE